jgi:hypothetical protein
LKLVKAWEQFLPHVEAAILFFNELKETK